MSELDNTAVSKVLGQVVEYPDQYDPGILVRELRQNNRTHLGIEHGNLPFRGYDVWNAYECSTLLSNGVPIVGALKIVYPCTSPYIVESKSLKLYLNSFNMYRFTSCNPHTVAHDLAETVSRDLSELLHCSVRVNFFSHARAGFAPKGGNDFLTDHDGYVNIDNVIKRNDNIERYTEDPDLLTGEYKNDYISCHSSLLKSNCRVTSQPDWGDVYIKMKGNKCPSYTSLAKYIISFRNENHFHEEICETIYKRLFDTFKPYELMVACLYSRRGGIDINPIRVNNVQMLEGMKLIDVNVLHDKTLKQ